MRKVLSKNLDLPLEGLRAEDKLNADLDAQLEANPHLFWDLEAEFGIKTDIEDFEARKKFCESLVTFADLVDYVERKIKQKPPGNESAQSVDSSIGKTIYEYAIRSGPYFCVIGFLTALLGAIFNSFGFNLGIGMFLVGIAIWGLANGGAFIWGLIEGIRDEGFKVLWSHPWSAAFQIVLIVFFVSIGAGCL